MSSAHTLPLPFSPFPNGERQQPEQRPAPSRRRTSPEQGRALEMLGHAIEYLVDSRLFEQWESPADAEAVQLLMACSRKVFADCEEVCPWHLRVQRALLKKLHVQSRSLR